jgi:hypothetical protein
MSNGAKVTKLVASASVRLVSSPNTHADAHWIGLVIESNAPAPSHCEPCIHVKDHRDPFPQCSSHCATSFLKRIHSDLHQLPVLMSTGFC